MNFSPDVPDEPVTTDVDEAEAEAEAEARRKAAADRRKKGRRATLLADVSEDDIATAFLGRPAGRAKPVDQL
jgi:hypothetical protein